MHLYIIDNVEIKCVSWAVISYMVYELFPRNIPFNITLTIKIGGWLEFTNERVYS